MNLFKELGRGLSAILGSDEEQYNENGIEGFKAAISEGVKTNKISSAEAKELMNAYKVTFLDKAKDFMKKIEAAIRITPSDTNKPLVEKVENKDEIVKKDIQQSNNEREEERE